MRWLKNSWLPVGTMLAVLTGALLLVFAEHEHGRGGPAIEAGIYPLTERFLPTAAEEALPIACTVEEGAGLAFTADRDDRIGLEVVPWDEVVIALEDHHPLTRSIGKALAEDLTGYLARHDERAATPAEAAARLVVMLPPETEAPMPLMVRRVLRVRTDAPRGESLEQLEIEQPVRCTATLGLHDVIGPAIRERIGLVPTGGIRQRSIVVTAEVGAGDETVDWPRWHLSVGRAIARAGLAELYAGNPPVQPWDEPGDHAAAVLARHQADGFEWDALPGNPPNTDVDRWYGSWQGPLVRGWGGAIVGMTVPETKKGLVVPTIERFSEIMDKGLWEEPEAHDDRMLWRSAREGGFTDTLASRRPWGWRLGVAGRHPQALRIVDAWLQRAREGDRRARSQLRRHLLAPALSDNRRDRIATLLRRGPDLAEQALLGQRADARSSERRAAAVVAWVRGIGDAQRPPDAMLRFLPDFRVFHRDLPSWDGRPTLVVDEERIAIPVRTPAGDLQVYWRRADGPPRYARGGAAEALLRQEP